MKKLFTLLMASVFALSLWAQTPVNKMNVSEKGFFPAIEQMNYPFIYNSGSNDRTNIKSEWFSFLAALNDYLGGSMKGYSSPIMPDSSLQVLYSDGNLDYVGMHSLGICFDPRDPLFVPFGNDQLKTRQPYTLDSFVFYAWYHKYNDDNIKDTLVIQVFKSSHINYYQWTSTPIEPWGTITFNNKTLSALTFDEEIRYLLDYDDTATWYAKGFLFGLNSFDNPMGPVAITYTFKPGYSYTFGDTLLSYHATIENFKKHNNFRGLIRYDESGQQMTTYNNGMFMNYETRYNMLTGNLAQLNGKYLPGSAWSASRYPYALFKITYDADWVDGIEDNVAFSNIGNVYPNPSISDASVEFELKNATKLSFEIINTMGQSIQKSPEYSYPAGKNVLSMPVDNLAPGTYMLRISTDNGAITKNFVKN